MWWHWHFRVSFCLKRCYLLNSFYVNMGKHCLLITFKEARITSCVLEAEIQLIQVTQVILCWYNSFPLLCGSSCALLFLHWLYAVSMSQREEERSRQLDWRQRIGPCLQLHTHLSWIQMMKTGPSGYTTPCLQACRSVLFKSQLGCRLGRWTIHEGL